MAHYAEISGGTVTRVLVVSNEVTTGSGEESEQAGIDFLEAILPGSGPWLQTSYNGTIRHNFAGPGYTWDADADAFYAPEPFPSWTLDASYQWQPPTPYPDDGDTYTWDEASTSWVQA